MKYFFYFLMLALITISFTAGFAQLSQIRVACIGNSITQGSSVTYPSVLGQLLGSHYNVVNYGIGGRTMLRRGDFPYWNESAFINAQDFDPHIIVLMLGTNDSKPQNWIYKDDFFNDYQDFVRAFRKNGKNPQFYVCFPPPAFIDNFGITDSIIHDEIIPLIDSVRRTENLLLINFNQLMSGMASYFADGIHPDNNGYTIMGHFVYDTIINSPSGFIRTFNANPQEYEQGDSVMLYWETSNESQVTLNGKSVSEIDSMIVHPAGTVPYTLIAQGTLFSDTNILTLKYIPPGTIKTLTADPPILERDAGDSSLISWTTSKGSSVAFEGISVESNSSCYVSPTSTEIFTLIAEGEVIDTGRITVPVMDAELINRALNRSVTAYSNARGFPPENAVDGDTTTYWQSSAQISGQSISVDLGTTRTFNRVILRWGSWYGVSYVIQSIDTLGKNRKVYFTSNGDGGIDDIQGLTGSGRMVRIVCNSRNVSDSGYILQELEVYTPARSSNIQEEQFSVPITFSLSQNYPNPFNPTTSIYYSLPVRSYVKINIYDLLGRQVAELVNDEIDAGNYTTLWNAKVSSGLYFYRMEAVSRSTPSSRFIQTRAMVVIK